MEDIRMSRKELNRLHEVERVLEGAQNIVQAAQRMGLSYRQARRVVQRYRREGAKGLAHRSRGRPSNRGYPASFKERVLALYQERLWDFGPTFAAEKLQEMGHKVDHETLRRWLLEAGLWKRCRKRKKHRNWRDPKEHFGEMVQMDGSFHHWVGTKEEWCLMVMVDDATGVTYARMYTAETTQAALEMLRDWIRRYGVPESLYTDGKSVYHLDAETRERLLMRGEDGLTQFGRACARLGIHMHKAHSPQAKGRVERKNGVFQDRLVKELRYRGIKTLSEVNALLAGGFLEDLNTRFAVEPAQEADFHRPCPPEEALREMLCVEERRAVGRDWTVRYQNRRYQLIGVNRRLAPTKKRVLVRRYLDGSLHLVYRGEEVAYKECGPIERKRVGKIPWGYLNWRETGDGDRA